MEVWDFTPQAAATHLRLKDITRLCARIDFKAEDGCWVWQGQKNRKGYGQTKIKCKALTVHRVIFAWLVAPLPKGQANGELDHICKTRDCCNPAHLRLVSSKENTLASGCPAAINARKTHCKHGHEFTPENTAGGSRGDRHCRTCQGIRNQKNSESQKLRWREHGRKLNEQKKMALLAQRRRLSR